MLLYHSKNNVDNSVFVINMSYVNMCDLTTCQQNRSSKKIFALLQLSAFMFWIPPVGQPGHTCAGCRAVYPASSCKHGLGHHVDHIVPYELRVRQSKFAVLNLIHTELCSGSFWLVIPAGYLAYLVGFFSVYFLCLVHHCEPLWQTVSFFFFFHRSLCDFRISVTRWPTALVISPGSQPVTLCCYPFGG